MTTKHGNSTINPGVICEASARFEVLTQHLADLDARRERIEKDEPPTPPILVSKYVELAQHQKAWKKELSQLAGELASAAKAWGMLKDASLISVITKNDAWDPHAHNFDILPAMKRIRQEASRRLVKPARPLDEPARRAFAEKMRGPADVGIISQDEMEMTQAEFATLSGLSAPTVSRRAAEGMRLTLSEVRKIKAAKTSAKRLTREESFSEVEEKFRRIDTKKPGK